MTDLQTRIEKFATDAFDWSYQRDIHTLLPTGQVVKLSEEMSEIADGILKNDIDLTKDGIGDTAVVVMVATTQFAYMCQSKDYESKDDFKIKDYKVWGAIIADTIDLLQGMPDYLVLTIKVAKHIKLLHKISADYAKGAFVVSDELVQEFITNSTSILHELEKIAAAIGFNFADCCEMAYAEIKPRTGKVVNGVFEKDA